MERILSLSHKYGYSHQYISQYWYYMDENKKLTVSFEGFGKDLKSRLKQ